MLDERVRMADSEGDVEEHLAGRGSPRLAAQLAYEGAYLLVARSMQAQSLSSSPDLSADFRGAVGLRREPFDLTTQPWRDPRSEVHVIGKRARRTVTEVSRQCAKTVFK